MDYGEARFSISLAQVSNRRYASFRNRSSRACLSVTRAPYTECPSTDRRAYFMSFFGVISNANLIFAGIVIRQEKV